MLIERLGGPIHGYFNTFFILTLERCSPFNSYSLLGRRTFKYLNAINATFHLSVINWERL
jgi:hypothetical protein